MKITSTVNNLVFRYFLTLVLIVALIPQGISKANSTEQQQPSLRSTILTTETSRVSKSSSGSEANSFSYGSAISADGRFVAYYSYASNLINIDTNNTYDVFVHDMQTGTTNRVSISSVGGEGNGASTNPSISVDGRFVAFVSGASNLVIGDTNNFTDIFVHDQQSGVTSLVSISSAGILGDGDSQYPSISADGRFVAFYSYASNLVDEDTNNQYDIFVHDRQSGETTRASVSSACIQGNNRSLNPTISADGRFIAFESLSSNLVSGDTNGHSDIFVYDMQNSETYRVSVSSAGIEGNSLSMNSIISRRVGSHCEPTLSLPLNPLTTML